MPDVITHLEAIRDIGSFDRPGAPTEVHERSIAALATLTGCTRAWRDTANGKEWFLLVPIDAPTDDRPAAAQSPE